MKKIITTIALALMPALFFAQGAFEKYEKNQNVTSFIAGKKTFAMIAQSQLGADDAKIRKGKEILNGVESIELYTTEDPSVASDMKTTVAAYTLSAGLEELVQVRDSGKRISIMIKEGAGENTITQVLAFISNDKATSKKDETILIRIIGNFDLDRFSEMLSDKSVTGDKNTEDQKLAEIKDALELKVSPNPASGVFYLNTDKAADVKVYDLSGRLVKQQTYSSAGIAVSDLAPATYVVEITLGDLKQTQKIVIK